MDYSLITEQQLQKRYDSLPDKFRELLNSENVYDTLRQISRFHYLDEERSLILEQLVALIILGFLSTEELNQEIQENIHLNPKHSSELTQELNRKIFAPVKSDLEKVYSPLIAIPKTKPVATDLFETKGKGVGPEPLGMGSEIPPKPIEIISPTKPPEKIPPPLVVEPSVPKESKPAMPSGPISDDKPFMIHQETEAQPVAEKKKSTLPSFGWFRKAAPAGQPEKPKAPESAVKVELETFGPKIESVGTTQKEKKEPPIARTEIPQQKVVHYREVETPTTFGKPTAQPPKEAQPPKMEMPAAKPIDTIQKPAESAKPFNNQVKPEPPKPLGTIQQSNQTNAPAQNNIPKKPANTIQNKPLGANQNRPEPPVKPAEPKVIDLDSFFGGPPKENPAKNEIELEGNTINLKNNKS